MMSSYYNTNKETGKTLKRSRIKAKSQEDKIYEILIEKNVTLFTTEQLWPHFPNTPITSIRRAITNLTNAGMAEKTNHMKEGMYGKQIHCYRFIKKQLELGL